MDYKTSQNLQENLCARVSFLIKLQAEACNFINQEGLAKVFSCEFCEIFKNTLFYRTPPVITSVCPFMRNENRVLPIVPIFQKQLFPDFLQNPCSYNFRKFTVKRLCWSLFNNVTCLKSCNYIKKRLQRGCFLCELCQIFKSTFYQRY